VGREEVIVPLVLEGVFDHALPILQPVLAQRGGPGATVLGFRVVLEITFLLRSLLKTLSPRTLEAFYAGRRRLPTQNRNVDGEGHSALGERKEEEISSIPWLLLSMPLPEPVPGVDLPWSADKSRRKDWDDSSRDITRQGEGAEADVENIVEGDEDVKDRHGGEGEGEGEGDQPAPLSRDEAGEGGLMCGRFICHMEVVRLLALTAMHISTLEDHPDLTDGSVVHSGNITEGSWGVGVDSIFLKVAEEFFDSFNRAYGGLVFSSPTMVAALRLARELFSPLASLFGY
ncbi:unnamed protein product, partial [Choristocarpus tenellus]